MIIKYWNYMLEVCIFFIVLCGFFGIIFKKNLVMKIILMDIMSIGVIVCYVLVVLWDGVFIFIVVIDKNVNYLDFVF